MKNIAKRTVSLLAMLSVMSACAQSVPPPAGSAEAQGGGEKASAAGQQKQVELTFWNYKVEIVDLLDGFFARFTEKYPNITVKSLRPGGNDYYSTIAAYFASGEYPDLLALNTENQTKQYADAGYLHGLSGYDFINSRFTQAARASVTFDGTTYTLPINAGCIGLLYNEKLFEQAGIKAPPQTLSEFRAVCEALKAQGILPVGFAAKESGVLQQIFSTVHTKTVEGNVWDWYKKMEAGEGSFQNNRTDDMFRLLDMLKEFGPEDPFSVGGTDSFALYGQQQCAMLVTGAWALNTASEIDPTVAEVSRMASVPISETPDDRLSAETSMGIGIVSKGEHIEECVQVLDWMSTEEGARLCAEELNIFMPLRENPTYPKLGEQVWKDTNRYISENASYPWGYMVWVTGLNAEIGSFLQEYYMGSITKEEFFRKCDEGWAKYTKPVH